MMTAGRILNRSVHMDVRGTSISVIVPCFNEIENVEPLVREVADVMAKMAPKSWHLIYVDDGSSDGSSQEILRIKCEFEQVELVAFKTNQGQTAAMDAGIRHASSDLLITMDADLQNDPADIPRMIDALTDDVGAVVGVRTKRQDSWVRRASSRIANWVRNKLSNETITDTGCSLKVFRRECFEKIKLFEGMHRFLPTLVKMEGHRVIEVPVNHRPRTRGESKYGVWNRVFKSFTDLLAVRWMKKRILRYEIEE